MQLYRQLSREECFMNRGKRVLNSVIEQLSYFAYGQPGHCCLCSAPGGTCNGICPRCNNELTQQMASACKVCGMPLRSPLELCSDCRLNMYYFDIQRSAGIYEGRLRSAIRRMKYHGERWLSRPLGLLLSQVALPFCHADMVVPIPLGAASKKTRGYNQARDLAVEVSGKISLPLADILVREEVRDHQAQLNRLGRWQNLKGTMKTADCCNIKGAQVLVVDDVTTTGATLDEAARALKHAGAENVFCVTLARTARH